MIAAPLKPSPLRAATLRKDTVYVTPRGRLCRLVNNGMELHAGWSYLFAYIGQFSTGERQLKEGFWLSEANLCILRPGARV